MTDANTDGEPKVPEGSGPARPLDTVLMLRAKATVKAGLFRGGPNDPTSASAPVVDRYQLHEVIGKGGFGTVFRAYDPKLKREVAVKLIPLEPHTPSFDAGLFDEARTMARLRHPSLVTVYDVGRCDASAHLGPMGRSCLFIVMELLGGTPLNRWLEHGRRSPRAIMNALIQAAQGIAAAHRRGVVHLDLKPSNIHVDGDRVVVLDFGLAKIAEGEHSVMSSIRKPRTDEVPAWVMGTPRYMAPEQHEGIGLGPATDQYSLAICLFEALYGRPPFEGETFEALARAKRRGRASVPAVKGLSRGQRRALARALDPEPARRFRSIEAFVRAIEPPRRGPALAVAVAVSVAALGGGLWAWGREPDGCEAIEARAKTLWNADVRARAERAFLRHGLEYGPTAWQAIERTLDSQLGQWAKTRTELCEQEYAAEAEERRSARLYCLDRYYERTVAIVELLTDAGPEVVANATTIVDSLERLDRCARDEGLPSRPGWLIEDAPAGLEVQKLIDRAQARIAAGDLLATRRLAAQAVERAQVLAAPALEASASTLLCQSHDHGSGLARAREVCEQALVVIERVGRDDLAVDVLLHIAFIFGGTDSDIVTLHTELARAKRAKLGPDPLVDARIQWAHANALALQGRYHEALAMLREVRATIEAQRGLDAFETQSVTSSIAVTLASTGPLEEARAEYLRAIRGMRKVYGPGHHDVGALLNNLGHFHLDVGELDRAGALFRRALEIKESARGARSPSLMTTLYGLARVHQEQGDDVGAMGMVQRGIALARATRGSQGLVMLFRAIEVDVTRAPGELKSCEELERISEHALSMGTPSDYAIVSMMVGGCYVECGDIERARGAYQEAISRGESSLELAERAALDRMVAWCDYRLGHFDRAHRQLEQLWSRTELLVRTRREALVFDALVSGLETPQGRSRLVQARALGDTPMEAASFRAFVEDVRGWVEG